MCIRDRQDVKWGFHACDGALVRLPHIIGLTHSMEMFLTGNHYDSPWSEKVDRVNTVVDQSSLMDKCLEMANLIATRSPTAIQLGKETIFHALGRPLQMAYNSKAPHFVNLEITMI